MDHRSIIYVYLFSNMCYNSSVKIYTEEMFSIFVTPKCTCFIITWGHTFSLIMKCLQHKYMYDDLVATN